MKFYRHDKDKDGSCHEMGKSAEIVFKSSLESLGHVVEPTTKALQVRHVDFVIDKKHKVEVKSAKRIRRADEEPNYELIWIELSNISSKEGKNGWLYGDADFIAFEQKNDFVFVRRDELAKYVEEKCDLEKFVAKPKDALYVSYRRWDRPTEHLTMVKISDILSLNKVKRIRKNFKPKNSYFLRAENESGQVVELADYGYDLDFEKIRQIRDQALIDTGYNKVWIVKQN